MPHPLAGIRLKLIRAIEKVNELHAEGAKFLATNPYGLGFEHYSDQGTGQHRVRARLTVREQPPLGYGIVLGEAVYHARSALDHLVYQLAFLNTNRPSGTQFPLAPDETIYRTAPSGKKSPRDTMLAGVREAHRAIIDSYQPYHDRALAKQNRLYVLGQFANADKHRVIQVGYGVPDALKVEPTHEGVDLDLRVPILNPPIEEGTEVFSVRWIDGYDDVPMHYEARFTLAYGFDFAVFVRRYYILETLELVNNIVNDFAHRVPEFG
jgi:hypothetical protein